MSVEPLQRGPEPRPDWIVTSQGAVDTELGILKTGKEADVFLVERADPIDPGNGVVMAAKRYRAPEHRSFHRSASYTEGRSMALPGQPCDQAQEHVRPRDRRRRVGGLEWVPSCACAAFGLPVPYPVQIDGTEILMEWITFDGETAPAWPQTRPEPDLLASYFDQVRRGARHAGPGGARAR
jgi:RIO kinase 1